jgi:diadenosine tetraphosphate (Ap4A) HIT family hydrolase
VKDCSNCRHIGEAEDGRHPWAVARLRGGYVWLNSCQYYRGAVFYVARRCVAELHELPADERAVHLMEMAEVAAAVEREFGARKMNYEALGNLVPHLHWWLTPRALDDPRPRGPIWEDPDFLASMSAGTAQPSPDEAVVLRRRVLDALMGRDVDVEAAFVS